MTQGCAAQLKINNRLHVGTEIAWSIQCSCMRMFNIQFVIDSMCHLAVAVPGPACLTGRSLYATKQQSNNRQSWCRSV